VHARVGRVLASTAPAAPRVHQRLDAAGHEAVVHENVFVDIELGVAVLEITRAVVDDAMAQREVPAHALERNRIGLDEAEPVERALKRGGREDVRATAARRRSSSVTPDDYAIVSGTRAGV